MTTDPYYDASGCLVTPEVTAVAAVPARIETRPIIGWNAGANSKTELDGDMHTVFTMPAGGAGVVIGFRSGRARNTAPDLVEHGLYFQSVAGYDMVQVCELGVAKTLLVPRTASDTFEIRRVAGMVTYWINATLLYTSHRPSYGVKLVNACLYASGDAVGKSASSAPFVKINFSSGTRSPVPDAFGDVAGVNIPGVLTLDDVYPLLTFTIPVRNIIRNGQKKSVNGYFVDLTSTTGSGSDGFGDGASLSSQLNSVSITVGGQEIFRSSNNMAAQGIMVDIGSPPVLRYEIAYGNLTQAYLDIMDAINAMPEFEDGELEFTYTCSDSYTDPWGELFTSLSAQFYITHPYP